MFDCLQLSEEDNTDMTAAQILAGWQTLKREESCDVYSALSVISVTSLLKGVAR